MTTFQIRKGRNLRLAGAPEPVLVNARPSDTVCVYPLEHDGIRPRLLVKEGDSVKRGSPLFYDKRHEAVRFTAPAAGKVQSIALGERRAIQKIVIDTLPEDPAESFTRYAPGQISTLDRSAVLSQLLSSGLFPLIRQRPFSRIANPGAQPKAIFVNGMNTAPFQADLHVAVKGAEAAFQAGLDALGRLTDGPVYLCLGPAPTHASTAVTQARHVEIHTFTGPHPAGNSSVHIHHLNPIRPGDVVWVVRGVDAIQIGQLFLNGQTPDARVIAVGGPGLRENARKHYRIRTGAPLDSVLGGNLADGEQRIVSGDMLSGVKVAADSHLRFSAASLTVLPESRERYFMGWMAPGLNQHSFSRLFLSSLFRPNREWTLNTNLNGGPRAMVLTGLYDEFLPMRIQADFLVRAVLAHDTDEAVKLGLLEVDPEDFALCAYACPSKMDLVGIIRKGLAEVEAEGL